MAVTGACLVLFVTFHAVMNSVAIFWPAAYNVVCEFLGANWYALVASAGLAALLIIHIIYAVWLTLQNRRARGNDRYAVISRPKQVEWASQNMLVLGIVILAFIAVHMIQFWARMQMQEIFHSTYEGIDPAQGTMFLGLAFRQPWTLIVYGVGFIALWFHLTHGFWSMFQSAGWNNDTWLPRLKCIGNWWTTIVVALFLAEGIVFTVQAHRGLYDEPIPTKSDAESIFGTDPYAGQKYLEGKCGQRKCSDKCQGTPCIREAQDADTVIVIEQVTVGEVK